MNLPCPLKILFTSCECDPYIKVDDLGDIVLSLAAALKKMCHDVRIVLLKYRSINYVSELETVGDHMIVNIGYEIEFAQLLQTKHKVFRFISLNSIAILRTMGPMENLDRDITIIWNDSHSFAAP
jgi:glycogen synthase